MTDKWNMTIEGIRHGAVKQGIDSVVDPFVGPISEAVCANIENPVLASALDSSVRFVAMMGIAEAIQMFGPSIGSYLTQDGEDASQKVDLLSTFIRKYAGERLGADAMQKLIEHLPLLLSGLKKVKQEDLQHMLPEETNADSVPEMAEKLEDLLSEKKEEKAHMEV